MTKRKRRLENGLFIDSSEHWEMWEGKVYVHKYLRKLHHVTKNNEKKIYKSYQTTATICIPTSIFRHLNLKNKQKICVAIRRMPLKEQKA